MFDMSNNISHNDIIVNVTVNMLITAYTSKNFIVINKIINCKNAYIQSDKILFIYTSYLKCVNKLRSKLYMIRLKKCKIINNMTIDMVAINEQKEEDLFKLYDILHKSIYIFNYRDLVELYKSKLNYLQFEYMIPKSVCNPYTNLRLSVKDHVEIYRFLLRNYGSRSKILPSIIVDFKNAKFDIFVYHDMNYHNLYYKGYSKYLDELAYDNWYGELNDAINCYKSIVTHYCYECSYRKYGNFMRILLHKFLIIHFLNGNNMYHLGDASTLCFNILKKADIWFDKDHNKLHTRNINQRRNIQTYEYDMVINVSDDDVIIEEPNIFSRQVSPINNSFDIHYEDE
jgi:hypothetical protein